MPPPPPDAAPESEPSPRAWPGLDRLGLVQATGGIALGLIEGLTKVFYPPASNTVIFVVMALVLLIKPAGLFGQTK